MKKTLLLTLLVLLGTFSQAQAATRPVNLTWVAPTGGGVLNYTVYGCTVPVGATSCTPNTGGIPLATVTTTSYSTTEPVSVAYGFTVVASYPVCTLTSSLSTPCGGGGAVAVNYVPVPPQGTGATNVVIVVP